MQNEKKGMGEDFAKFFEKPDRVAFRELLKNHTGEQKHLDFKEIWIEKSKLARHIIGFANSEGGMIVFGVKEDNKTLTSEGLPNLEGKTEVKQRLRKYIPGQLEYSIHDFEYDAGSEYGPIANKKFQVLIVEDKVSHIPFLSLNNGENIEKNRIYYRGAVNTEEATHDQVQEIINRRIGTNYSTQYEQKLVTNLNELKELYRTLPSYMELAFAGMGSMGYSDNMSKYHSFVRQAIQRMEARIIKQIDGS